VSVNTVTTATKQAKIQLALQLWPELLGWWQHVQQLAPALEARSERHAQQLWYGLGRWAERCYTELLSDVSTVVEDPMSELHVSAKQFSDKHLLETSFSDASCSALNGAEPRVSAPSLSDISCSENSCSEKSGSANSRGATETAAVTDTPAPQPKPDAEYFAALALACYQAAPQWPASERLVRLYDKWRQWPDIVAAESASLSPSATHFGAYPPHKIPRGALAQQLMQQLLERMMQSPDGDTELIFAHDFWDRRLAARCGARHSVLTAMLRQAPCIVLDEVYRQRVEDGVLRYVQPLGYQGFFAENTLWRALFTLVLWPVLYHQGEMHNDFELRPRSLMQPGFYQRHQAAIEAELAVLQPLTPDGLAMLLQRYQQIVLCQTDLVRWPAQFSAILVLLWYGRWQTSALALQGLSPQTSMSTEPSTSSELSALSQPSTSSEPSALSLPMSSEPMPTHGQASALQTPDVTAPPPVVVSEMGAVLATVIRRMAQDFPRNSQGFPDLLLYKALNDALSSPTDCSTDCLAVSGTAVPLAMLLAQVNTGQTNTAGVDLEQLTAIAAAYPAWVAHIGGSQAPVSAAFELQLVEVKASGDQLRAAQLARLQWFLQLDVAAAVLRVEWGADPQRLYAVVDVETTGGKSEQDRITEIAVVQVRAGKIVGSWSSLVNPERKIPRYIQRLTGISDAMVANAPTFSQVWPEIASYFADAVFVAHNVNFDYGFVRAEAQRAGQTLMMPRLCTVVQSRRCWPGLSGYGLAALAEQLDLPLTQHHRAHADAWATAHLLLKLQAAGGGTELQSELQSEL
jgi:DNA polymerase III epsilon subunit family exonuclease